MMITAVTIHKSTKGKTN